MAKPSDNTMRELDDILNGSETDADRLTAFLKLKTAAKPPSSTKFVLGGFDYSFDLDVDLVKLPPKPQPKDAQDAKEQPLRETTQNSIAPTAPTPEKAIQEPATSPARENVQPQQRSASKSPRRSLRRSGGVSVPGSDRLRRVAIQRRSRSLGRRDLLREFNEATTNTSHYTPEVPKDLSTSASTTLNFLPKTSSTPDSEKKATGATAANATPATENLPLREQFESSMLFTQRRDEVMPPLISTSQRSLAVTSLPPSSQNSPAQRTYVVEMGPEPGQLLLSPSDKRQSQSQSRNMQQSPLQLSPSRSLYNASLRQSALRSRLSSQLPSSPQARQEILAPDTPPRVLSVSRREPEFTVPESQPTTVQPHQETIQHVLQTLSSSPAVTPFVVIPVTCLSPKPKAQVESQPTLTAPALVPVASRSIQTSRQQDLSQLITDDDSDNQQESSSVPLNLAPPGGNTTRQRRLRKRNQRLPSPNQLLDLHYSRSKDAQRPKGRAKRQTVLNKESKPAINGEQFAEELARMSNYEILDLRKRHSRGKMHPLNGHRQELNMEEQQVIEEHIEWEIIRRNLESPNSKRSTVTLLPASPSRATENLNILSPTFKQSPLGPPVGFRDNSVQEQHSNYGQTSPKPISQQQQQRRSRLRHRETSRVEKMSGISSASPAPPPDNFRDKTIQEQGSVNRLKILRPRRDRSRCREPTMSEDELLAICTPPSQFRWSKTRQQEKLTLSEPVQTPLAEPPEQYRRSRSRPRSIVSKQLEMDSSVLPDPPEHFRQSRSKMQEQLAAVEKLNLPVLSDPPTQSRLSKSMQMKKLKVVVTNVTSFPAAPNESLVQSLESNEPPLEDSPPHVRMSRSRLQKTIEIEEPGLTTFRDLSMQHVNAVRTSVEGERSNIQINTDEAPSSSHMDEQQSMERIALPGTLADTVLDEQPSTSKAAKSVASKSGQKTKEKVSSENKSNKAPSPDDVFKKPTAPAPRSKRKRELTNLIITLPNSTIVPDGTESVSDSNTTGVRKSRRGQVPLRNTWVHSEVDAFAQMRKTFETYLKPAPSKPKKQSGADRSDLLVDRPPLCSSTPRNATAIASENNTKSSGKRKRGRPKNQDEKDNRNQIQISGIAALSSIAELPDDQQAEQPEEQPLDHPIDKKAKEKKRVHGKKVKVAEAMPPPDIPSLGITTESPTSNETPDSMNQQEDHSFPLINWLRDVGHRPVCTEESNTEEDTDSLTISRASNLIFSNVNSIDYAFYTGEQNYKVGYMRLAPLQDRGYNKAKRKMRFVALHGQFCIEINSDGSKTSGPLTKQYNMNTGDFLEIKEDACYNITNSLNEVGLLFVNRS